MSAEWTDKARVCGNPVTDILYKYWAMRTEFEMAVEIESIVVLTN